MVVGNNFGVNMHHVDDHELDIVSAAGLRIVRIDSRWQSTEIVKGAFNWSRLDGIFGALRTHRLRALVILDYSNSIYAPSVNFRSKGPEMTKTAAPTSPEARAAFARWAAAVAQRYSNDNPIFEIWNEPNVDSFWPPAANPQEYAALAADACAAIRREMPTATIVAPGTLGAPTRQRPAMDFLSVLLTSPAAACLDGISVHPYLSLLDLPETLENWNRLRNLIGQRHPARLVPISSESGLSTGGGSLLSRPPDEWTQAFYAVRMMLLNFASGIPVSIWYDFKDDGPDSANIEHRYGLVRQNLEPKPVYQALKATSERLGGSSLACVQKRKSVTTLVFVTPRKTDVTVASWSDSGGLPPLQLPGRGKLSNSFDMFGALLSAKGSDERPGVVYYQLHGVGSGTLCGHPDGPARE